MLSQVRSRQYNADIQIHTVRHAMLEQLRNPPAGGEPVPSLSSLHSMWFNFEVSIVVCHDTIQVITGPTYGILVCKIALVCPSGRSSCIVAYG